MSEKTTNDLLKAQEGSILGTVNQVFLSREFRYSWQPLNGEEVLGKITDFEAALFTVGFDMAEALEQKIKMTKGIDLLKLLDEAKKVKEAVRTLSWLAWESIMLRFPELNIGIRGKGEIVEESSKSELNGMNPIDFVDSYLSHIHDCENCPSYDECDLSIKRSR